ncbi:MAG: hypothetical protein J6R67_07900 [Treponema sp.]|nr:hypothetical protein [Treponema sp.]
MAQKVADGTKKKSPESEAQIMALILTVMVWLVVAAFIILFPGKILQNQEPQVYQDISLRLSAVDGNSFTSVASAPSSEVAPLEEVVSEAAVSALSEERMASVEPEVKAPLPVSETPAGIPAGTPKPVEGAPVKKTPSVKPVEGAPVKKPASAKPVEGTSVEKTPPSKPLETAPVQKPAMSPAEPVASQSPSAPPVEPVDIEAMDDAAWEALFEEKGSRSYNTTPSPAVSPTSSPATSSNLSGVAGSVEKDATLSHESEKNQSSASGLSQETAAALERITSLAEGGLGLASTGETTAITQSAGTTVFQSAGTIASQSAGTAITQSAGTAQPSTTGTDMNLVGGGSRRLLEPKEPVIVISEKNQSLIMGTIEVAITFEITPEGLVLPSSIKISPESLVHGQVQAEIKSQIEKWRFQVAQGSGQVRFKCNIIKK